MNSPRLSICIPTFNRAEVLNECLDSIVPQCIELGAEICISDNASTDHTVSIIEAWQNRYPNIRLNRHEKNLRIDRNIVAAGALATGELIWFLSDDDVLEMNAVKDVLALADRHRDIPAFILNRREYDATLTTPIGETKPLLADITKTGEAAIDLADALVELAEYLGYLPAWLIRRDAWTQIQPTEFLDTDFVHVGVGLAGCKLWSQSRNVSARIVVANTAFIRCRLARASWRNRHYEVWIRNWQRTMRALEPYVGKTAATDAISLVTQRNYLSIVSGRGMGPYGLADFKNNLQPFIPSTFRRSIAILVAVSPRWMARYFTKFQRFIRESLADRTVR